MRTRNVVCLLVLGLAFAPPATAQTPAATPAASPALSEADALYQSRKWVEAAEAYEAVMKTEPGNGRARFRRASALHAAGRYEQAIAAWQSAAEVFRGPLVTYNLACSYARSGDREKAFEWLKRAVEAGLPQPEQMRADEDLATLRSDPRFQELLAAAERISRPCSNFPEHRQFDFWVGEWDVQIAGQSVGRNLIERLADGCIIMENWASAMGGQIGKSLNFYNPVTGKWHQTYVDNGGSIYEMDGSYKDGALRFEGTIASRRGLVQTRTTFFNLGPDRVRQLGEQSTDGGKTWTVVWDAIYVKKK